MRLKLLAAAMLGAAFMAPACALAATFTETANITTALVPYSTPFSLAAFDPSLGTLQSVEFVLNDTTTASVLVENNTGATKNFTNAFATIPLTVTGPGGLSLPDTVTFTVASGTVNGKTTNTYMSGPLTDSANRTFTTGLSAFEGSAPLQLSFDADAGAGSYGGTAAGNIFFSGSANAGGAFEIIYTYAAAVPEPATWAFLMLGVGAVGAATRKRRKAGLPLAAA